MAFENDSSLEREVGELKTEMKLLKEELAELKSKKSENLEKSEKLDHPPTQDKKLDPPLKNKIKVNEAKKSLSTESTNLDDNNADGSEICNPIFWKGQDFYADIHGTATTEFAHYHDRKNSFDIVDFNPVFIVSYKDLFLFRGAVDFAINDQGDTDLSLDFANINWFMNDFAVLGAGKFDSALGQFVQNISPDWINKLPTAPVGFDADEAAPQSDIGIHLQGGIPLACSMKTNYIFYFANAPRAIIDTTNNFIDHISTDGSTARTSNYVFGGRLGFLPIPEIEMGVSAASGKLSSFDLADNITLLESGREYNVLGADATFQWKNLYFRGEIIQQLVKARAFSIAPAQSRWMAWYLQLAYLLPTTEWEPVVRYGEFKTPFSFLNQKQWAFGINYWFAPSIVAKFSYQLNRGQIDTDANANALFVQVAYGF